jgi:outer membrane protein insertion porin family
MTITMKKTALIAVSTAIFAGAALAQAVSISGNRRVDSETIRSYFTGNDAGSIQRGVEGLKASGLFRDVRVNGRNVVVVENDTLYRVAIEGNKKVKSEVIAPELSSKARGPYSVDAAKADAERIVEIYRRSGFYDISVEPKTINNPNGRLDLVFEVTEGKKSTIKKISFVGNSAYSAGRLKDEIASGEGGILGFLKTNNIYDTDRLNSDQEALRRFYLRNGYADFRVVSAVTDFDREQNGFFITITVDEGAQYRFGDVGVVSNIAGLDGASLRGMTKVSSGGVYNLQNVDKTIELLTVEASKRGYAFAQVRPRGTKDAANRLINVSFVIEEGPRVYVERIQIRGNTRTKDSVVRREFDMAEGDAFNRALVDRAERRLNNTQFFKTVKVVTEPGSAPDRVVIHVDVEDQSTGSFSLGGGYSTSDGFMTEVSVSEKNFLGRGQYIKVGASLGQRSRGFDFSFTEPYFMDQRLSAGFDLFTKDVKRSTYANYDTKTAGGALRLGIPITEELAAQVRYSLFAQRINLVDSLVDCVTNPVAGNYNAAEASHLCVANGESSVAIREINGVTRLISMAGYSLIYNSLDRIFLPSKGVYAEFKQDFAGIGGDARFIKTEGEARFYVPIMEAGAIGSLRLSGGNVTAVGGSKLKVMDQFFKGPELVRGFASSGIGPRDYAFVIPGLGNVADSIGGTNYLGASAEVTFPFAFLPKEFGMRGALFADAGSLWGYGATHGITNALGTINVLTNDNITGKSTIASSIRSSVGIGLLWESPFGPIRFDYAWPIQKQAWDRVQQFRFSGGTKF